MIQLEPHGNLIKCKNFSFPSNVGFHSPPTHIFIIWDITLEELIRYIEVPSIINLSCLHTGSMLFEMADELEMYQNLSLFEKERGELVVEPQDNESTVARRDKCLVVSLLIEKYYNRDAFKNTMRKIWQPVQKLVFKELGSKLLLVEFKDEHHGLRVMCKGPWSFDRNLVLLKEMVGNMQVSKIQIREAFFWIRLLDMSLLAMNERVRRLIVRV